MNPQDVMVGWTTVTTEADARKLASVLIERNLVACAQISGPITSIYCWEGAVEESTEFRITLKFAVSREPDVRRLLESEHPYEVPQWIFCRASGGSEKYLNWVGGTST